MHYSRYTEPQAIDAVTGKGLVISGCGLWVSLDNVGTDYDCPVCVERLQDIIDTAREIYESQQ